MKLLDFLKMVKAEDVIITIQPDQKVYFYKACGAERLLAIMDYELKSVEPFGKRLKVEVVENAKQEVE